MAGWWQSQPISYEIPLLSKTSKRMDPILNLSCIDNIGLQDYRVFISRDQKQQCHTNQHNGPFCLPDHFQDMDVSTSDMCLIYIPWWFSTATHSYPERKTWYLSKYGIFLAWIKTIPANFDWIKKIVAPKFKKNGKVQEKNKQFCCILLSGYSPGTQCRPAACAEHKDDQCILKICRCFWKWKKNPHSWPLE